MNCNTTHYRANSSSVPGDPTGIYQNTAGQQAQNQYSTGGALAQNALNYATNAADNNSDAANRLANYNTAGTNALVGGNNSAATSLISNSNALTSNLTQSNNDRALGQISGITGAASNIAGAMGNIFGQSSYGQAQAPPAFGGVSSYNHPGAVDFAGNPILTQRGPYQLPQMSQNLLRLS